MHRLLLVVPLLTALAACGFTDEGGGTRTLMVNARLTYEVDDNATLVQIRVEKDGLVVPGAIVEIRDADAEKSYVVEQEVLPDGEYNRVDGENHIRGYLRRIELRVESDRDRVEAKLEGPGKHRVSAPENNAVLKLKDLGDNLEVAWSTDDGLSAQEVQIRVGDHTQTITDWDDPGSYDVPATALEIGDEHARVLRRNRIRLAGGSAGSVLLLEYEARNSFVLE